MSMIAGPLPRYGTCVQSIPSRPRSSSGARWFEAPTPEEPKFSLPGCALASAITSCRLAAGRSLRTVMTLRTAPVKITGVKSRTRSNPGLAYIEGLEPHVPIVHCTSVVPSGVARAASAMPRLPPAPPLFSTMMPRGKSAATALTRMRATMSLVPAGVNGTITRTGRSGIWPNAGSSADVSASNANVARRIMAFSLVGFCGALRQWRTEPRERAAVNRRGTILDDRTLTPARIGLH